jgi:hypothetical protein
MSTQEHLLLDPSIRDWVVIPMVILLVLVALGRNYVSQLIKSTPTITADDLDDLRFKQVLQQAQRLRMNGRFISDTAFNMRKSYLIRKKTGILREKVPGATNPMSNPMAMMDMMKGNIVFMLPNFAMMAFVGYFFSGFVCLKIPFPLPSNHFKLMMQRGVDLTSLDVSYVSSLSWYFLVTFGLNGIMRLLLGSENEFDDTKMMQMQVRLRTFFELHLSTAAARFSKVLMYVTKLRGLKLLFKALSTNIYVDVFCHSIFASRREISDNPRTVAC